MIRLFVVCAIEIPLFLVSIYNLSIFAIVRQLEKERNIKKPADETYNNCQPFTSESQ